MRTLGPKVFILHSQFHCIQFYVIYTIARHLLTWLLFESINSTLFYIPSECFWSTMLCEVDASGSLSKSVNWKIHWSRNFQNVT